MSHTAQLLFSDILACLIDCKSQLADYDDHDGDEGTAFRRCSDLIDLLQSREIGLNTLIAEALVESQQVAILWGLEDVLVIRPDLTDDEAWAVLQYAEKHHDAGIGLNWHLIESAAECLFGPEPDAIEVAL
jgi:hypothetical protein